MEDLVKAVYSLSGDHWGRELGDFPAEMPTSLLPRIDQMHSVREFARIPQVKAD